MLDRFGVAETNWRDAVKTHWDFEFSETPHFVGRAIAALAADPQVRRKSGLALFADDLAEEYGFTDLDGSRPHFWRSVCARSDQDLAGDGDLSPEARWFAAARYQRVHLTPALWDEANALAARLGFERLGAGLAPIDLSKVP